MCAWMTNVRVDDKKCGGRTFPHCHPRECGDLWYEMEFLDEIPAFAGMTKWGAGMTVKRCGDRCLSKQFSHYG